MAPVRHPCYHSGYQAILPLSSLYDSPCIHTTDSLNHTQNLTVEGTGDPGNCVVALRSLFNFSSCKGQKDCAFNGIYQPPVHGQFYVSMASQILASFWSPRGHKDRLNRRCPGWLLGTSVPMGTPDCHTAALPQACTAFSTSPGIFQLLLHLPFPEPHVQAITEHCQRHCLEVLSETLETGG